MTLEALVEQLNKELKEIKHENEQRDNAHTQVKHVLTRLEHAHNELAQQSAKDRSILHKLARRALLDDARRKVVRLLDPGGTKTWHSFVGSTRTRQRLRTEVDSILNAAGLPAPLSAQRSKFVDLLLESNMIRTDGNQAAHETTPENMFEAVQTFQGDSELKGLLVEVFHWVHGSSQ